MPYSKPYVPVSLIKRLLAIIYDLLLLTAICFAVAVVISIFTTFIFNDGNAITEQHPFYLLNQIIILSSIIISSLIFYVWFWTHGGQTLGMKTWRIQLVSDNNGISKQQAAIRFFAALISWSLLGLGFIWSLFDSKKRCWHDILSSSHLIQLEAAASSNK